MAVDGASRPMLAEIAGLLNRVPEALVTVGNAFRGKRLIPGMTAGLLREVRTTSSQPVQVALERVYRVVLPALSEPERGVLAQAAAAPGLSVDKAWMEEAFGEQPVEGVETLNLLSANSPRLRLAAGLRGVALEGQDVERLRENLYEHLAEQLKLRWLDFGFMNDELGNLLGLLEWSAGTGRHKITRYLTRILDPFLTLNGLWDARGRALEHFLFSVRAVQDRAGEAWGMHQLGTQHLGSGDLEQARSLFEQARDLRVSLGDNVGAAYSQHNLDLMTPPPPPPQGRPGGRGGLSPWVTGLLVAGLAAGAVLILAVAGSIIARRVRVAATPPPLPTFVRAPTSTARPRPTRTEERISTLPPSLPPSLDWSLEPEFHDVSDQMTPGCHLSMIVPRVRGATDLRVAGFNAVVDQFMEEEIRRRADYFRERFGSSCDPAAFTAAWSDDYRITTWPAENYMEIVPTLIFGDSATYTSSDICSA
jgi:hypothetical protein